MTTIYQRIEQLFPKLIANLPEICFYTLETLKYAKIDKDTDKEQLLKELEPDKLDYNGCLHELADGLIDVYNHPLRVWAVDNYKYIDEALEQGIISLDHEFDYHKAIMAGQYLYYQEKINEELSNLREEIENEEDK